MQNKLTQVNDTKVKIEVSADADTLALTLQQTLKDFQKSMKLPGFREGKAPLNIVEKNADQSRLQASFIDSAINDLYSKAVIENDLKPVSQPSVSIKKFVPFSLLEVEFEVEVIGKLEITDYKKIRVARKPVTVTAKDIADTMESLQDRFAEGKEVKRAAKDGDQVVINFHGFDSKTKEPISGADGKAYPLVIGSNAFIPGFEPELIGLKPDEEKTFEITFPKDYNVSFLQNKKVTFEVKVSLSFNNLVDWFKVIVCLS
ncbi:MAG: trigger factor [bacterium]